MTEKFISTDTSKKTMEISHHDLRFQRVVDVPLRFKLVEGKTPPHPLNELLNPLVFGQLLKPKGGYKTHAVKFESGLEYVLPYLDTSYIGEVCMVSLLRKVGQQGRKRVMTFTQTIAVCDDFDRTMGIEENIAHIKENYRHRERTVTYELEPNRDLFL